MIDFHNNWREFLKESSLSRLHQHTEEHATAILTAHRAAPDDSEGCITDLPAAGQDESHPKRANSARNRDLKAMLLRKGYGVTRVDGSYIENFEDPDPLKRVEVSEESFFVVNLNDDPAFVEELKSLGELFCQDSILIIPQGGRESYLLGTNNTSFPGLGNRESVGDYSPGREAEFMSRVGGRPFTFKEVKDMETFDDLSRNAKWVVAKITERLSKRTLKEQQLSDYESVYEPGKIRLFHFTRSPMARDRNRFVVDPAFFTTSRGSYSRNEWKRSRYPRSFYYTDPTRKEHIVTGNLFSVDVSAERIYNLRQDPDGYLAKHRHPTYGLRNDMEWTEMFEDIADSYGGVYYTLGEGGAPVVAYFAPLEAKKVDN